MPDPFVILAPLLLLPIVFLLRFIGCTSFHSGDSPSTITIDPASASLGPGESQTFTATVTGTTEEVQWSANAPKGVYTAPNPIIPPKGGDSVTASIGTDAGATKTSATATVTFKLVSVTVSPATVKLGPGQKQTFTAAVQNSPDQNVNWGGAPGGVFTAPNPYTPGTPPAVVTATAQAEPFAPPGTATIKFVANSARFVAPVDTTTRGTWNGVYGQAGYALAAQPANILKLPPYLPSLTLPGPAATYSFADPTLDARGLQKPPAFTARFADTWFDPNVIAIQLNFSDLSSHRVAIYCFDFDTTARHQTVEMVDSATGLVLDTQTLTDFNGGVWLQWDLSGQILLRITHTAGLNAVICGIFFG
jgi:hypothetical protein